MTCYHVRMTDKLPLSPLAKRLLRSMYEVEQLPGQYLLAINSTNGVTFTWSDGERVTTSDEWFETPEDALEAARAHCKTRALS